MITVEVNGYLLPGILVDTRASRSACSLNTLDYLDVGEEEITKEKIFCKGFDNSQTEVIETVQLAITIDPLTSITKVMVVECELAEPLILGRT